jgi:hypothetical protein
MNCYPSINVVVTQSLFSSSVNKRIPIVDGSIFQFFPQNMCNLVGVLIAGIRIPAAQ